MICLAGYLEQPAAALAEHASSETLPAQRAALHARLRQPLPAPAPVPAVPPTATETKGGAEQPQAAKEPLNVVPDLPPAEEQKPQADEVF